MLLHSAPNPAPNPRRVAIFLAEKGVEVPTKMLSMRDGEHRADGFAALNPRKQVPALELDDGTCIAESVSICRYLEALHPAPPLFGATPLEQAQVDMWIRRVEFTLMMPVGLYWVHAHPFTAKLLKQYTDFGQSNVERWESAARWFDAQLAASGQDWLAGGAYSMADIVALTTIDFAAFVGLSIPDDCPALSAWHGRASARPSAAA